MKPIAMMVICVGLLVPSVAHASVNYGDTGPEVKQVQEHLKWFGYSVKTDGVFGPQTLKAVRHWQRANGLTVDGIVGPATAGSMAIRGSQTQLTQPPSPPGPPRPPEGLSNCDEMSWYRQQAGLPEQFDVLGYRESNCRNEDSVRTFCCYGYWQHYISSHLSRQSAYRERIINECGVTGADDINSDNHEDKTRQACVTKVVYDISRFTPWG